MNMINGWLGIPSSMCAESVTIDMQHDSVPLENIVPMLLAISTTDAVPMVRVSWNEPGIIMQVLDAGAYGVIFPMVNTVQEARVLVSDVDTRL